MWSKTSYLQVILGQRAGLQLSFHSDMWCPATASRDQEGIHQESKPAPQLTLPRCTCLFSDSTCADLWCQQAWKPEGRKEGRKGGRCRRGSIDKACRTFRKSVLESVMSLSHLSQDGGIEKFKCPFHDRCRYRTTDNLNECKLGLFS